MLGKMLVHGLVAAILIGSAAAVYAETKDNATPSPTQAQGQTAVKTMAEDAAKTGAVTGGDGYIRPTAETLRQGKREHGESHHKRGERRHDDDDD